MKKLITPLLFMLFSLVAFAQSTVGDFYKPSTQNSFIGNVSTSISTGASMSFMNKQNLSYSTFVASKVGYQLTPKLRFSAGFMRYTLSGNTFLNSFPNERLFAGTANAPISGDLLFVEGEYQLKPKLFLAGNIVRSLGVSPINSQSLNFNSTSLSLKYKLSEKSSIGVGATISNGTYNNMVNPMQGNNVFNSGMMGPMGMFPAFGQ